MKRRTWEATRCVGGWLAATTLGAALVSGALTGCGLEGAPPLAAMETQGSVAPLTGPCPQEGRTRECHVKLGEEDGVLDCFVGTQECRGGAWSACSGESVTLRSSNVGAQLRSGDVALRAAGAGDDDPCDDDPCNPFCRGHGQDAGLTAEGGGASYYVKSSDIFGGAPGGFAGKSDCGSSSKGCNEASPGAAYPRKCNGNDHYSRWDACLADTHCDVTRNGGKGECVANWDTSSTADPRWDETTQRWSFLTCPTVDLTVSAACEVGGVPGFNVCNRGNLPMLAGLVGIHLDNGNASFGNLLGAVCPVALPSCFPSVPGGILLPGKCLRVTHDNCPAWTGAGNPVAYVNSLLAIAECGGPTAGPLSLGPSCNNNWADVKNQGDECDGFGNRYLTATHRYVYDARCDVGHKPRWRALTYDATVPCSPGACNGTNAGAIEMFGTLSENGASTAGDPIPAATTRRSVACTRAGASPAGLGPPVCPVDLQAWAKTTSAGEAGPSWSTLTLDVRVTPTPDNKETPTLARWDLTYDCVPNE